MTDHFNAVRGTVTDGGTGNLTVSTTGTGKGRPLSVIPVGSSVGLRFDDANGVDWELSRCTMLTSTTLSRDTLVASSTGSKINLSVGTTALQTAFAEDFNAMMSTADIPFSAAIPLTRIGSSYMAAKVVNATLTLTPAANAVRGALVYLRVIADGVNLPNYSAFKEWGGSMGYDNRNGIENQMQFFFDGFNYFVSISQVVGAVAVPLPASAVTLTGPTSGVVSTASTAFTVGVTPAGGAITGSIVVTPTPVTGVTFSPTSLTLSSGTPTGTFTATSSTTGVKSIAVTNNGGLSNPSAITFTVAAAATAPAQMAAPTATAGDTTASVALVAPATGGSSITGYTVTSSPAGMVDSNAGSTSLTHAMTGGANGTAYTFTATATNAVGTSPASPASNSVTLAGSTASSVRLANLSNVTESASAPYSYTANNVNFASGTPGPGGVATTKFQSGVDGSIAITINSPSSTAEPILGVTPNTTLTPFNTIAYALYGAFGQSTYKQITNGTIGSTTASLTPLAGDILRMRRSGTSLIAEVARSGTPTAFTVLYTWTGVSTGILYIDAMNSGTSNISALTGIGLA